jgi:hypothetical protein
VTTQQDKKIGTVVAAKYYLIMTGVILMRLAWTAGTNKQRGRPDRCTKNFKTKRTHAVMNWSGVKFSQEILIIKEDY